MPAPDDDNNNRSAVKNIRRGLAGESSELAASGRRSLRDRRERLERREQSLLAQEKKMVSPGLAGNETNTQASSSLSDLTPHAESKPYASTASSKLAEYLATTDDLLNGDAVESKREGDNFRRSSSQYSRQSSAASSGSSAKAPVDLDSAAGSLLSGSSMLAQDDMTLSSRTRVLAGESGSFSSLRRSLPARSRRSRKDVLTSESESWRTRPVDKELVDSSAHQLLPIVPTPQESASPRLPDKTESSSERTEAMSESFDRTQSVGSGGGNAGMTTRNWEQLGETKEERMDRYKQQRRRKLAERVALLAADSSAAEDTFNGGAAAHRWGKIAEVVTSPVSKPPGAFLLEEDDSNNVAKDVATYIASRRQRDASADSVGASSSLAGDVRGSVLEERDEDVTNCSRRITKTYDNITEASAKSSKENPTQSGCDDSSNTALDTDKTSASTSRTRRHRNLGPELLDSAASRSTAAAFSSSSSTTSSVTDALIYDTSQSRRRFKAEGDESHSLSRDDATLTGRAEVHTDKVTTLLQESAEKLNSEAVKLPVSGADVGANAKERGKESSGYSTEEAEGSSAAGDTEPILISELNVVSTVQPANLDGCSTVQPADLDGCSSLRQSEPSESYQSGPGPVKVQRDCPVLENSSPVGDTDSPKEDLKPESAVARKDQPTGSAVKGEEKMATARENRGSLHQEVEHEEQSSGASKISATINRLSHHQDGEELKKAPKKVGPVIKSDVSNLLKKFNSEPTKSASEKSSGSGPSAAMASVERRREKLRQRELEREAAEIQSKKAANELRDRSPSECNNNNAPSDDLVKHVVASEVTREAPALVSSSSHTMERHHSTTKTDTVRSTSNTTVGEEQSGAPITRGRVRHRQSVDEKSADVEKEPIKNEDDPTSAVELGRSRLRQRERQRVQQEDVNTETRSASAEAKIGQGLLKKRERADTAEKNANGSVKIGQAMLRHREKKEEGEKGEEEVRISQGLLKHREASAEVRKESPTPPSSVADQSILKKREDQGDKKGDEKSTEWNSEVVNALLQRSNKIDQQIKEKARPEFRKQVTTESNVIDGVITDEGLSAAMRRRREFNGEVKGVPARAPEIRTNAEVAAKSKTSTAEPPLDPQLANLLQARRVKNTASNDRASPVIDTGALMRERSANRKSSKPDKNSETVERSLLSVAQRASFFLDEQKKVAEAAVAATSRGDDLSPRNEQSTGKRKRRFGGDIFARRSDARFQTQPVTHEEVIAAAKTTTTSKDEGASEGTGTAASRSDEAARLSTEEKLQRLGTFTLEEKLEMFAKRMFFPCELRGLEQPCAGDDGSHGVLLSPSVGGAVGASTTHSSPSGKKTSGRYMTQPVSVQDIRDAAQLNAEMFEEDAGQSQTQMAATTRDETVSVKGKTHSHAKDAADGVAPKPEKKPDASTQPASSVGRNPKPPARHSNIRSKIDSGLRSNNRGDSDSVNTRALEVTAKDSARRSQTPDIEERKTAGNRSQRARSGTPDSLRVSGVRPRGTLRSRGSTPDKEQRSPSTTMPETSETQRRGSSNRHSQPKINGVIPTDYMTKGLRTKVNGTPEPVVSLRRSVKSNSVDSGTISSRTATRPNRSSTDASTESNTLSAKRKSFTSQKSVDESKPSKSSTSVSTGNKTGKVKFTGNSASPSTETPVADGKPPTHDSRSASGFGKRGSVTTSSFRQRKSMSEDVSAASQRSGRRSVTPRREVDVPSYMKPTKSSEQHVEPMNDSDNDILDAPSSPKGKSRSRSSLAAGDGDVALTQPGKRAERPTSAHSTTGSEVKGHGTSLTSRRASAKITSHGSQKASDTLPSYMKSTTSASSKDRIISQQVSTDETPKPPIKRRTATPSIEDAARRPSYMQPTKSYDMHTATAPSDEQVSSGVKPKIAPVDDGDVPNFMKATESYYKKVEHLIDDHEDDVAPVVPEKKKLPQAIGDGELPNFLKPTKNYQNRLEGTAYVEEVPEIRIPPRTQTPVVLGSVNVGDTPSYMKPTSSYEAHRSKRDSSVTSTADSEDNSSPERAVSHRTKGGKEKKDHSSESLLSSDKFSKRKSLTTSTAGQSEESTSAGNTVPSYMRPTTNSSHRVESSDDGDKEVGSADGVRNVSVDGETVPVRIRAKRSAAAEDDSDGGAKSKATSIYARLALLQKQGDEDWKRRVNKEATDTPTSIHNRVSQIQVNSAKWQQNKGAENDARQFTVAGRMQSTGKHLLTVDTPLLSRPTSTLSDKFIRKPASMRLKRGDTVEKLPLRARSSLPLKSSPSAGAKVDSSPPAGEVVEVKLPEMDDMSSFFLSAQPAADTDTTDGHHENAAVADVVEVTDDDINHIFIESRDLLPAVARAKPQQRTRRPASRNPLKALSQREDVRQAYTQVTSGVAERERKRLRAAGKLPIEQGLHTAALAGLAKKEDLRGVRLRKTDAQTRAAPHPGAGSHQPYKDPMLIQVKGRRFVQSRMVEPVVASLNSGDCFILVTKKKVFNWIGEYSNVLERSRSADLAAFIHTHKDLGCRAARGVTTLKESISADSTKQTTGAGTDEFWAALSGSDGVTKGRGVREDAVRKYGDCGSVEEDQLYESYIIETNRAYRVEGDEMVPVKDGCGEPPQYSILKNDETLVFDFGSEIYAWYGSHVPPATRRIGLKFAEQLQSQGYDYSAFDINPLAPLSSLGSTVPMVSKTRPTWTLLGKVSQKVETCLFKEKFFDWPDSGKIMEQRESSLSVRSNSPSGEELKAIDGEELLGRELPPVNLTLENSNVGRGSYWLDYEDGLKREYQIDTESVTVWHTTTTEFCELEKKSFGQFHSADSYVVKWQYRIRQIGIKTLKGHESKSQSQMGRVRYAYFFWQGANSSINEKGTSALMAIDLNEEKGPHVRVEEGLEPPCFLHMFDGAMVVHSGKRGEEQRGSGHRLFVVTHEVDSEVCLREVEVSASSLRSRASFLLFDATSRGSGSITVWHGAQSPQPIRASAWRIANSLREAPPPELGMIGQGEVAVTETEEGGETAHFLRVMDISRRHRVSYDSLLGVSAPKAVTTPRLFHLASTVGQFEANEIPGMADPKLGSALPFSQDNLYQATQPALFLLDAATTGARSGAVYLWQGWWPKSEGGEGESTADAGSALARYNAERRISMETALDYSSAKYGEEDVKLLIVYAGHEPTHFTNLFSQWVPQPEVADINEIYAERGGEESLQCVYKKLSRTSYSLTELQERPLPEGVDPSRIEVYLCDEDFQSTMEMTKESFKSLPSWKKASIKKKTGLF